MRASRVIGGVAATVVTVMGSLGLPPSARASNFGMEFDGTYVVKSDGEWAKTNDVFIDEQTVVETWTVRTDCVSPIECSGEVTSDHGWTGSVKLDDFWYVRRDIPNWMPCPDGTFATGHQLYLLYGFDPAMTQRVTTTDFMAGRNVTKSDSGACGVNKPKVIELPVSLQRVAR
ncbi:hypothetical protein Mycch_3576 [Mycolicibacterium chubuense NBB4]|uniref:Uncharacterized protein n=1 Tax=Mycolicibacterium chubuense (strain NBB4) TaxID=710421 RepID=I4BM02_MYCCN|nr:hypothetical protein [Mycolicibacterium chubuense]AFM18309.1 hypothetical protein Mycch_3576 [Mycolicibacterium chubuense NBB4]